MMHRLRRAASGAVLILTAVAAAELAARFDDWLHFDMSIWSTPDNDTDLKLADSSGIRGRPYGRYQKFALNNHGFRSRQDNEQRPRPDCRRVMTLGASETLGLLEPVDQEYPAQLAELLGRGDQCYEVLNGGVAGMSLPAISYTWSGFWRRFEPAIVVVYPTPAFYLGERPPQAPVAAALRQPAEASPGRGFSPRLWLRAKDAIEYPAAVQRIRVRRKVEAYERSVPSDSIWSRPPSNRLALFRTDLEQLVAAIKTAGATPVVLTHARRFAPNPAPSDRDAIYAWRSQVPRAGGTVLIDFDTAAARITKEVAVTQGVILVDVDCHLSGKREMFGDPLHFTAQGAQRVAELVANAIDAAERTESRSTGKVCPP